MSTEDKTRKGHFVSSKEFPAHDEGMGIWVPKRVKRRHQRELREIARTAGLPADDPKHIDREKADEVTNGWIREVGIEWNWLDHETGEPLPQPSEDPDVLEELSEDEIVFIITHAFDGTVIPPPSSTAS